MVRQVAERLASLFCDENIKVICVLGGPFVGKTWLVNYVLESENKDCIKVFDNVNTYDEFEEIIEQKEEDEKYVIVGRLGLEGCKARVDKDVTAEYVMVYPMNYKEFVLAMPVSLNIYEIEMLKIYMMVGGLPEVVKMFVQTGDIDIVRDRQCQLLEEICNSLTVKARKVVDEVIKQELLDNPGFCVRQIDSNARDREYAQVIEELVNMGLIERYKRLLADGDGDRRKYKLKIYDIGIYSMALDLRICDLCSSVDDWNRNLLYDFYYKELRTYIDRSNCAIKYWRKCRAKAKIAIVMEKSENENIRYMPVTFYDRRNSISRSAQSFIKDYSGTISISVPMPTKDKVTDGCELYKKMCNNT